MTFLTETEAVIQTDSRGRVRVPKARREALLDEFEKSGMTARAFARLIGVKEVTFSAWTLRRKRRAAKEVQPLRAPLTPKPFQLLEAVPEDANTPRWNGAVVVELPGGARVEIASPGQLPLVAELVRLVSAGNRASQC